MIARLSGTVVEISGTSVILDVQGVGYLVSCSSRTIAGLDVNSPAVLTVHTEVREDDIALFGFSDQLEREVFQLLLQVKGVGAKSALDIISQVEVRDLLRVIGEGNVQHLQRLKRIGKKTAERIVVELRDKVAAQAQNRAISSRLQIEFERTGPYEEAIEALEALGFQAGEARSAIDRLKAANVVFSGTEKERVGEIVREALKFV